MPGQIIFHKGDKNTQWKRIFSVINIVGNNGYHIQKNKTQSHLKPCTKMNSKWIKDIEA